MDDGVIQTQLGEGNWQALTDGSTLNVTDFRLTMNLQPIGWSAQALRRAGERLLADA